MTRARKAASWIFGIFIFLVILGCLGIEEPMFYVFGSIIILVGGPFHFLARVIPLMQFRPVMILSTLIYAVALIGGSHLFLGWLYQSVTGRPWRMRWTISGVAMVFMLFASGLAAVGVMDHAKWLIASTQPLFKPRGERGHRAMCASNLHQIGLGILLYEQDNAQQYPPDLSYLLRDEQLTATVFVCPSANDEPFEGTTTQQVENLLTPHHCSYVYLGKGLVEPVPADKVIAYEPLENHQGEGMNVLYGDGHVEWLDRPAADSLLAKLNVAPATQAAR